jgi:hypothetical protein
MWTSLELSAIAIRLKSPLAITSVSEGTVNSGKFIETIRKWKVKLFAHKNNAWAKGLYFFS